MEEFDSDLKTDLWILWQSLPNNKSSSINYTYWEKNCRERQFTGTDLEFAALVDWMEQNGVILIDRTYSSLGSIFVSRLEEDEVFSNFIFSESPTLEVRSVLPICPMAAT